MNSNITTPVSSDGTVAPAPAAQWDDIITMDGPKPKKKSFGNPNRFRLMEESKIEPDESIAVGTEMEVPGVISHAIFSDPQSGFSIVNVELNTRSKHFKKELCPSDWLRNRSFIAKGQFTEGVEALGRKPIVFVGKLARHEKYGNQLKADFHFVDEITTRDGMEEYLKMLPNVGAYRASQLLKKMTPDAIAAAIENDLSIIVNLKIGLTPARAEDMREKWMQDKSMREVYFWLGEHGIERALGKKIVKQWGAESIKMMESDTYALTDIKGIGFKTADEIAFKVMTEVPADKRTSACLRHVLYEAMSSKGHLCLPYTQLLTEAITLLQPRSVGKDYAPEVRKAVSSDRFVIEKFRHEMGAEFIYVKDVWEKERDIASHLVEMSRVSSHLDADLDDIKVAEQEISAFMQKDVSLNVTQSDAIMSAFKNKITVITGGGGTGKSTICRCICTIARSKSIKVRLMAPTGKAAKVMKAKTGNEAGTIHRSLGMLPGEDVGNNLITEGVVVIDEFSMCGIDTVNAIMKSLDCDKSNLVIVGDHQQLPSVSPGNFLHDIIMSGVANVIKLDRIYRQDEKSYITVVANNIAKGINAKIPAEADDIKRMNPPDPTMMSYIVCDVLRRSMSEKHIPIEDMHVMASIYKGDGGVDSLNMAIQEMMWSLNGNQPSIIVNGRKFCVGDKVMQIENDYEKMVFNGDVGFVLEAGHKAFGEGSTSKEAYLLVAFDDSEVVFKGDDFDQLRLAWCTTVHKFQGSQCKYIIFVAPRAHTFMLSKELVYTAITRAEKKVIIMADQEVLDGVPKRVASGSRHTGLVRRIAAMRE